MGKLLRRWVRGIVTYPEGRVFFAALLLVDILLWVKAGRVPCVFPLALISYTFGMLYAWSEDKEK